MSRTPWDAQEAVNIINNLKSQLQKSIEREEQIERELQVEKARADELSKKIGQLEAAEAKVNELVGDFIDTLAEIRQEALKKDFGGVIVAVDRNLSQLCGIALSKAKEATRNTKTD